MIEAIFIACAAVAAVSALIAIVAVRRCNEQIAMVRQLCGTLSAERGRIATHDIELDRVTDALRKLSGRIAAEKSRSSRSNGEDSEVPAVNRLTWKAQMREKYGVVPSPKD
jgi:hypothetical protein